MKRFLVFLAFAMLSVITNTADATEDMDLTFIVPSQMQINETMTILTVQQVPSLNITLLNHTTGSSIKSFTVDTASQTENVSIGTYDVLIVNGTEEIVLNNNGTGYAPGDTVVIPLYCDPPRMECFLEDGYYIDAPWRVESSLDLLPMFAIINTNLYEIECINVYDHNNNDSFVTGQIYEPFYPSRLPLYTTLHINKTQLILTEGKANVSIKFCLNNLPDNEEGPLEIQISDIKMPELNNWYSGDTHYHSAYTSNEVEFGGDVKSTADAGKSIGLDWITITDHSFDLDTDDEWNELVLEANNNTSNNFIITANEELSCDNQGPGNYNHYLAYNISNRIFSGEVPDGTGTPMSCSNVVQQVNSQGGFGYVAHPMYREGWGITYRNEWQNYSLPFTGMEIWNGEEAINELEQGLVKWRELLLSGRKIFVEAGSDAHGDFNSALGKVRTACFARNFTKDNIFTALRNGNCMMTDGPIVVFTANKHIMGESFNVSEGDTVALNISWNSTNEFGNVTEIFLIRGEIQGTEINETILTPNNLSGNFILTSTPNNTYYRIEARSIDSEGTVRRAYTNPIWAYAEPKPEVEKIPMDETELALVARFENKYDYSLKDLFFDAEPTLQCENTTVLENLNLNNSWKIVKCEKKILDNKRLMWTGLNNTETNEKRIVLQIGNILQYTNATYNPFVQSWHGIWRGSGMYQNNNWMAYKNEKEIFEINEIYNTNPCPYDSCSKYFGTYLLYGFEKYEGNTTAYFTHWGYSQIPPQGIQSIFFTFDNKTSVHLANSHLPNTEGVLGKKTFAYNASSFSFGASGAYVYMSPTTGTVSAVGGSAFDPLNRSIFPVSQTESKILCYSDIDCNNGDLFTKDICANAGTTDSKCEHSPQEPEEIKKPFTEMDADEVSKAIDFKARHNKTLGELYFDGWKNTSCNYAGILETLYLDKNWSIIQCQKFSINGTTAMFAGLNNTKNGEKYVAYQLGNELIDEMAQQKQISESYRISEKTTDTLYYYDDQWTGINEGATRFEIDFFKIKICNGFGSCTNTNAYGTDIIHGFEIDDNKNTAILYSFNKSISGAFFRILFDNYKNFSIENETINSGIYESKVFDYRALNGWTFGTFGFNYQLYNRSLFKPYRSNDLIVGLESPAHLRAQDTFGRITGYFNGTYLTEIPNSEILDMEHEKYLLPANESYRFFVEGYTDGNYSLKITRANGENSSIIYFKNISATNETSDSFEIDEAGGMNIKTNDSEKNIIVALDGIVGPSENIEFTTAKNKSVSIDISNWSALNESTTITENIDYAPEIISTQPDNGSSFGQWQNITLGVYATDQNNDSIEYLISFDGAELARANETTYILNEIGTHLINFSASDGPNTVSEESTIYVIAPPKVTIISPENRTYNESNISISAVFEEHVDTAWISVDGDSGQNYTKNTTGIYLNLTLSDGIHYIRTYAKNSIGIENYSEVFFTVNTTALTPPTKGNNGKHCGKYKTHGKRDKDERDEEKEFCKELKPKKEKDKDDKEDKNDELENDSEDDES